MKKDCVGLGHHEKSQNIFFVVGSQKAYAVFLGGVSL